MKNRVTVAERTANSMDAQRKSTLADMAALQKKVCFNSVVGLC